jgi:molybdopterin-binding protein
MNTTAPVTAMGAATAAGGIGLCLDGVAHGRAGRRVLDVASLAIAPGESLAIVGPNGAGKSTLLALLAGLEAPAHGAARIGELPATRLEARRRIVLMPQDAPLLEGTVAANVERPLALRGVAARERRRRVGALLERMGLGALAGRNGKALSGGEARRVALARALVTEPEALLLDEPFNGVDDPARERLVAEIRAGVRAAGRTLVLVTQRRDEALRLATRLVVLWQGSIRQDGPIEQVLARPADTDVARFLGLENVLRGRVVSGDGDVAIVDLGGVTVQVALPVPRPALGPEVWVIFGPEQVELRAPEPSSSSGAAGLVGAAGAAATRSSPRNVVRARVRSVVPREGRVEVALAAGFAGGLTIVAAVTRAAVDELHLAPGADVQAVIKATALHVVAM